MPKAKATKGRLPDFTVSSFGGINTSIKNLDGLTPGVSPDALNWLTGAAEKDGKYYGDHIELRRGMAPLAASLSAGTLPISGLGVGIDKAGNQIPVFSVGKKIFYYDATNNIYTEIGTDLLGTPAQSDDVAIVPYQSVSGYYIVLSSPNSSIVKINLSNLANPLDLNSIEERGYISLNQGRLFLWNRIGKTAKDLLNLRISYADGADASTSPPMTTKTGVVGPATDGVTKVFSGNLAIDNIHQSVFGVQISGYLSTIAISAITKDYSAKITANSHSLSVGDTVIISDVVGMTQINNITTQVISVVDANNVIVGIDSTSFTAYSSGGNIHKTEYFADDQAGNLFSQLGGTGTINYITGAYTLNFNTAPLSGNLVINYFEDDSTQSLAKFLVGTPTISSQGYLSAQLGMGKLMNVFGFSGIYFCFHQFGVFQLIMTSNDVTQINQSIYRNDVGIPYWRSGFVTGDGIIYLDTLNSANPKLRQLVMSASVSNANPAIIPESISDQLDLTLNGHNQDVVYEWGDYYILDCESLNNGIPNTNNDRMYVQNKKTGFYDLLDYRASCHANYNGALLAGDSISSNPLVLFSGFDDLGFNINNYWKSAPSFLGAIGIKSFNKFVVKGLISPSQNLNVYLSFDGGQPVLLGSIDGSGKYVNQGVPIEVGGPTIGTNIVGGGGVVYAYPYEAEIVVGSDHFNRVQVIFRAEPKLDANGQQIIGTGVGYLSIDEYTFKDIRYKSSHILNANVQ